MVQHFKNGVTINAYFVGEETPLEFKNVTQMSRGDLGFIVLIVDHNTKLLNLNTLKYIDVQENKE